MTLAARLNFSDKVIFAMNLPPFGARSRGLPEIYYRDHTITDLKNSLSAHGSVMQRLKILTYYLLLRFFAVASLALTPDPYF
jgi:hypothetical protein